MIFPSKRVIYYIVVSFAFFGKPWQNYFHPGGSRQLVCSCCWATAGTSKATEFPPNCWKQRIWFWPCEGEFFKAFHSFSPFWKNKMLKFRIRIIDCSLRGCKWVPHGTYQTRNSNSTKTSVILNHLGNRQGLHGWVLGYTCQASSVVPCICPCITVHFWLDFATTFRWPVDRNDLRSTKAVNQLCKALQAYGPLPNGSSAQISACVAGAKVMDISTSPWIFKVDF